MYRFLESALKDGARFVQKRMKGSDLKFQILPPKQKKEDQSENVSEKVNSS